MERVQKFEDNAKKLIQAAVETAEGDGIPPPELALAWECRRYPGALPEAGGIYDQPAAVMYRMAVLLNVYDAVVRVRGMVGEQIHQLTGQERKIIKLLLDEELL